MKAWKTVAALVLALGLTAGFAACGDDKGNGVVNNSGSSVGGSVSDTVSDESSDVVGGDSSDVGGDVGEIVGEEVTQEEFLAARAASYAADNFTVVRTTQDGSETIYAADGKVHIVGEETEGYKGAVDGVYYEWTFEDDYWLYEEMEWEKECAFASGEDLLDEVLYYCQVLTYWDFDAETGMYKIENFQSYTAYAMVSNGKIVKCRLEISATEWVEMEITYGNATVGELPPLE